MTTKTPAKGSSGTSNPQSYMSIGQLAEQTGVSSRTIRYYEELGILPRPPRSDGGTRRYPPEYKFYVEGALALKELGFNLEEIKLIGRFALGQRMTEKQRQRADEILREKMQLLEKRVAILNQLLEVLLERSAGREELRDLVTQVRPQEAPEGGQPPVDHAS